MPLSTWAQTISQGHLLIAPLERRFTAWNNQLSQSTSLEAKNPHISGSSAIMEESLTTTQRIHACMHVHARTHTHKNKHFPNAYLLFLSLSHHHHCPTPHQPWAEKNAVCHNINIYGFSQKPPDSLTTVLQTFFQASFLNCCVQLTNSALPASNDMGQRGNKNVWNQHP